MGPPVLLLVDDEPDFLDVLHGFASDAAPQVVVKTAGSGREALAMMAGSRVDAIVCDYRMPDLNGIQVLQRAAELAPRAKRILMTAYADSLLPTAAAAQVRLDGFLEKAMDPGELRRQLLAAIGGAATA